MHKKINFLGNKLVSFSAFALVVFGSLMIASAEMGTSVGDSDYLTSVIIKQVICACIGIATYFVAMNVKTLKLDFKFYVFGYVAIGLALIACRFFGQVNGAYAWIRFSGFTIQPSEFAKVFMIMFGAKMLGKDHGEDNVEYLKRYAIAAGIYFFIILVIQKDLGSGVVLLAISFLVAFIPPYKEIKKYQRIMFWIIIAGLIGIALLLSPPVTNWMKKHSDNYMAGRFLAAADPFLYRYDNGYHVIMALVSFANGGLFGLGYGNSIHKYMNFPNPSNDFILPVIVEELGFIGFAGFVITYTLMLVPLVVYSIKTKYMTSKIILLGVFSYFVVHFILNVGGVSALIPLTGVPLLLISSGGSSLLASMMSLGFAQHELIRNQKKDESDSGEIQKDAN